jgi:serine/threonine protein kinase
MAAVPFASPGEWQEIFALLDTALELDAAAQTDWLAALGPQHRHLSPMLARLLQAHARIGADDFLQPPLTGGWLDAPAPASLAPGALVGAYRLLREIGQGGMASVWLAERADGLLDRRVALKLPHVSWGAASFADRMARERNILASLTHPHIARLYDAGVADDGRPFLALEYVEGEPIDAHATAQRLTVRARVQLAVQVARAVAHAHARLVVHRDLKPSNILVDAAGQAHLLDFGIAKLVDPSVVDGFDQALATHAVGRPLTPDYASPEQIRGDPIGTASDIYSFGVVVFELLAGARPYRLDKSLGAVALAGAVERVRVPRASEVATEPALRRQLAGDLDAIVGRALAKASEERYPTMDAFADDLERHLRGEPVDARPDGWWYHAERWVRRHRLETAVGAAVLVAVLSAIGTGAGVALWQMRVARRQAQVAREQAARAAQVKDFALSILQGANTDSGAGAATTATDVLKAAHARVETELADQPETAVELMASIGDGLLGLAQHDAAADVMRKAVELGRRALGPAHPHTVAAMVVHGAVLVERDQTREAIALLAPAIAEAKRQHAVHTLLDGLRWLGQARMKEGEIETGLACVQEAVAVLTQAGAAARPLDAVTVWASLASALSAAQRPGVADAARRSLAHAKALYGERVTESTLVVRSLLATGLAAEGRDAEALAELDSALVDMTAFFGPTYPRIANIVNFRGHIRLDTGDAAGAIDDFRMQLACVERLGGEGGSNRGLAHAAIAKALAAAGRSDEALQEYETGIRLLQQSIGTDNPYALRFRSAHALVLARTGRLDEAEQSVLAIEPAMQTLEAVDRAMHAGRLSVLRRLQGRHEEAIALGRAAVDGLHAHPATIVRANASVALGSALLAAGRSAEALGPLRNAVRLFAEKQLAISPDQADARAELARAEAVMGPP